MSTILKALKKLEERKASDGRRQGDIAWDILREQPADSGSKSNMGVWLVILVLVVVVTAAGMIFFFHETPSQRIEPVATAAEERAAPMAHTPVVSAQRYPARVGASVEQQKISPAAGADSENEIADLTGEVPLIVSGIAFHANSESRIAIVNELPVMVGTVIEGMVVERIEQHQVIFSRNGKLFAVSFPESN